MRPLLRLNAEQPSVEARALREALHPHARVKLFRLRAIGNIQKNGHNKFHDYHYITEADLMEAVRGHLSDAGIAFFVSADRYEVRPAADGKSGELTTVFLTATFACTDTGATYTVSWMGTGADKSDKGIYKAYTGGLKYLLMKTFQVSTNDDPELPTKAERDEITNIAMHLGVPLSAVRQEVGIRDESTKS